MSRLPDSFEALRRRLLTRLGHRQGLPLREGNDVALLEGGEAWLAAVEALIRGARERLVFEMYIWADDPVGRRIQALLREALGRGVAVRGVVDALGSFGSEALLDELRTAGAELRLYHRAGLWLGRPLQVWNRRNHRKILVADGDEAVVGSANWSSDYDPQSQPEAYLDLGVALRGPSVADLGEDMDRLWRRCGGRPAPPRRAVPGPRWPGPWTPGVTVQVVTSLSRVGTRAIHRHLHLLIRHCQHELWIANAYFLPGRGLTRALARAARRGVDLRILLPGRTDQPFVQAASRHGYGRFLRAGVRIFERRSRMLHVKAAVVDGVWAVIGTANLDSRSFRHNLELNLALHHPGLAARCREIFLLQAAHSHPVELEAWERRGWAARWWGRLAHAFRWWL